MDAKTVCIIGGSGFVGLHLANRLAAQGYRLRVLTRRSDRGRELRVLPHLQLIETDLQDERQLTRHFSGCHAVINLAGIANETRSEPFRAVHVDLPRRALAACRRAGVPRYLHMSALGADPEGPSRYLQTKGEGEQRVMAAPPAGVAVTSFRPAVIFGPEDRFLNRLARLLRLSPGVVPLPVPRAQAQRLYVGDRERGVVRAPGVRLQPVYVGDVAAALVRALEDPDTAGRSYELCGPQAYTLAELVGYIAGLRGLRRRALALPGWLAKAAAWALGRLPGPPFSVDNYRSGTVPNVCRRNGLEALGLEPTALEAVAPAYLGGAGPQAGYAEARREAGRGA